MKFDMSAAWRDAVAMISANREVLFVVAGIFFFLPSVLMGFTVPNMEDLFADPEKIGESMGQLYSDYGWLFILVTIAQIAGYLALLSLLRDHHRPTVAEAMKSGVAGLLPAVGTYLIAVLALSLVGGLLISLAAVAGSGAIATLVGLIAFVGFVYVAVKISLSAPVIAIDKVYNPVRVLVLSWQLTKGNSFRLALFFLMIFLVYLVVSIVIGLLMASIELAAGETVGTLLTALVSGFISAAAAVIFVAVLAAIHRQMSGPSHGAIGQTFE